MEQIAINALVIAVVQALVALFFYRGFHRTDAKLDRLENRVQTLDDEEIKRLDARVDKEIDTLDVRLDSEIEKLDERLTADHRAHGDLHTKINTLAESLPALFVTRRECGKNHEELARIWRSLEKHDGALTEISSTLSAVSANVGLLIANKIKNDNERSPS